MKYRFYFKKSLAFTHVVMYSGLAGWYNEKQCMMIDFNSCIYNLPLESDDDLVDMMIYHLNLAFIHSLIDQNMFYGECEKEGWNPKYTWNQGLILSQGMGDLNDHKFRDLFPQSCKKHEKGRIMRELNPYTRRHKRPTHYYKKRN